MTTLAKPVQDLADTERTLLEVSLLDHYSRTVPLVKGFLRQDIVIIPWQDRIIRPVSEDDRYYAVWDLSLEFMTNGGSRARTVGNLPLEETRALSDRYLEHVLGLYPGRSRAPGRDWELRSGFPPGRMSYRIMGQATERIVKSEFGDDGRWRGYDLHGRLLSVAKTEIALCEGLEIHFSNQRRFREEENRFWRRAGKYGNVVMTLYDIREALLPALTETGALQAVVYGSHGRGEAHQGSDLDLLVVADRDDLAGVRVSHRPDLFSAVRRAWGKAAKRDMDLIVLTNEELSEILESRKSFGRALLREGKIVWQRR